MNDHQQHTFNYSFNNTPSLYQKCSRVDTSRIFPDTEIASIIPVKSK
jgi:hypothetical protein